MRERLTIITLDETGMYFDGKVNLCITNFNLNRLYKRNGWGLRLTGPQEFRAPRWSPDREL